VQEGQLTESAEYREIVYQKQSGVEKRRGREIAEAKLAAEFWEVMIGTIPEEATNDISDGTSLFSCFANNLLPRLLL